MGNVGRFAGKVAKAVPRRLRRAASELAGRPLPIPGYETVPVDRSSQPEVMLADDMPADLAMFGVETLKHHGWFRPDGRELYPDVAVGPDDVVADIGCGDGSAGHYCARAGARVILSDLDAERLEMARIRVAASAPDRVEALHGNGEALPIADQTASVTICMEVIEHVDHPPALCAELFRITRPGGTLLITCPDPRSEAVQEVVAAPLYFEKPNHVRIVQHQELKDWVTGAGFELVRQDSYGFYEAVRWSMFWSLGVDVGVSHPAYEAWGLTWKRLLATKDGYKVQRSLDRAFPKSQVVVARRP